MRQLAKTLKALSDPSRLKILKMLQRREMCVCELTSLLQLAQPTVSKHLKALEQAGLVRSSKRGLWVDYRLAPDEQSPYAAPLLALLAGWLEDDPDVERLAELAPFVNRENLCRSASGSPDPDKPR